MGFELVVAAVSLSPAQAVAVKTSTDVAVDRARRIATTLASTLSTTRDVTPFAMGKEEAGGEISRVAVAIPHAGDSNILKRCLDALGREKGLSEVVVIVPQFALASVLAVEERDRCTAVVTPRLESFARATNRAAAASSAPYVLLLNDDAIVRPGAVVRLAAYLDARPDVGAVAPKLLNPDGSLQPSLYCDLSIRSALEELVRPILRGRFGRRLCRSPQRFFPDSAASVEWASAAALLVRRSVFEQVGCFDERYPHGIEDAALCLEFRRVGAKIVALPEAEVIHLQGASGLRHPDSEQLARALSHGVQGWELYMETYRPGQAVRVRLVFLFHALVRYVWFRTIGRIRDPARAPRRSAAYARHLARLTKPRR